MPQRPPRVVKFVKAEVTNAGGRCKARVELRREPDHSYFGNAESGAADLLRAVAQATANALLQAASADSDASGYEIRVKQIVIQDTFGKDTVLVSLAGTFFNQRRDLLGLCVVEGDQARAAAFAVLNATNRFLGVG